MSPKPLRVYILGAGCSACGGYPLASEVPGKLDEFANSLSTNSEAENLLKCVKDTVAWLNQHEVSTTDQLAQALGRERKSDVELTKKAMSALFFSLEDDAAKKALPSYSALFEELFEQGDNPEMEARVRTTNCRVLTYNYDRLFERCFIEWVKQHVTDPTNRESNAVTWLNSSLHREDQVAIEPDQFTLIKLHGGVGQFNRDHDYGLNHVYPFDLWKTLQPIADDPYFEIPGQPNNHQTIFYPADKRTWKQRKAEAGQSSSSYEAYEEQVWDTAEKLMRQASEVQIIGYSMSPIDWFGFKELFRESKVCGKVVIRNRRECLGHLVEKMKRLGQELKIEWEVEGLAEDFFGRSQLSNSH